MREDIFLAQARVLTDKHEALAAATGQSFNLFAILCRESDEVRTHSAILAELLDPNGTHGQGAVFTRLFAQRFCIPSEGIESVKVRREASVDSASRIDILMWTDHMCVVVENKIDAGDQHRQLERYHAYGRHWGFYKVFYLTLHGDEPGEDSFGHLQPQQRAEIECISYASDVIAWLDDCIKEVARIPQLREILAHYQALLRKLTGKATGELTMELRELLLSQQGGKYHFELVPGIVDAMTEFSVDTEWGFWQATRDRMLDTKGRSWSLELVDGMDGAKTVSRDIVRHAHGPRNKDRWNYGWTVRITSEANPDRYRKDEVEVLMRVECSSTGWGLYRIIAVQRTDGNAVLMGRSEAEDLFNEWKKRVDGAESGWYFNAEKSLAWAYPSEDVLLQKKAWLEPKVLRQMVVDAETRRTPAGDRTNDLVESFVSEVHTSIDRIESSEP